MKQVLKSVIMLITSIVLFTAVVYAWFSLSDQSIIQPVDLDVTDGFSFDYEIKYYTEFYVYRFDSNTNEIQVYDTTTSSWVSPMNLPGGTVYLIDGVFISQYDVLIPENNHRDNMIIEISVDFTNDAPMIISQRMVADPNISAQLISSMTLETSRAYYASEVSNIQTFLSDSYNGYDESFNKYDLLNTEFNLRDGSNNLIYPMHSFYVNSVHVDKLELGESVIQPGSTMRFYYNFSYNDLLMDQFFNSEFPTPITDIANIPMILFFQDIQTVIYGGLSA